MFIFLKALSRSVHDDQEAEAKKIAGREEGSSSSFTVWRKSLLMSCNGFTVIDSSGDLVYRVDNYSLRPQQLVLMDAAGKSILTLQRRKKLGLSEKWEVFEGETWGENSTSKLEKPAAAIWSVIKKKKNILEVMNKKAELAYVIEGSYRKRECKVMDESRKLVAEIKRKETVIGGVHFGEDVFVLVVHSSFHSHFAMALLLLLDNIFS